MRHITLPPVASMQLELRSMSLEFLPSCPGAGCVPSGTTALPVASRHTQPHPGQPAFARDLDFHSKACYVENFALLWYHGALPEGSPGLGVRAAPAQLASSKALPWRAPTGISARQRLLGNAADAGKHLTPCGGTGCRFLPLFQRQKQSLPHRPVPFSTPA